MKDFWKKHKLAVALAGYALAVVLFAYFLIFPLVSKIQTSSDEIQKNIIDGEILKERVNRIPEMRQISQKYNDSNLEVVLSPEEKLDFIKKVEKLADETNNKMDIKITEEADKKPAKPAKKDGEEKGIMDSLPSDGYMSLSLILRGDYPGLINFLHKLENLNYYVNVVALNSKKIAAHKDSEGEIRDNIFSASMDIYGSKPQDDQLSSGEVLETTIDVIAYLKKEK